jgi:dolichyl-phosphate beta-glucosyltransferase
MSSSQSEVHINNTFLGVLVVPFFNEGKRFKMHYFENLIGSIGYRNWTLLLVNDGSHDNTLELLYQLADTSQCLILDLPKNVGKGNAVRLGMNEAMKLLPNLSHVGFLDSDGAFDIDDIRELMSLTNNIDVDCFVGSRIKMAGTDIYRSALRHVIGRIIATLLNFLVLKTSIYDPQSGLKIFKVSENLKSSLSLPFKTKWFGDVELISRLWAFQDLEIRESPLATWKDVDGGNLKISSVFAVARELLVIFRSCKA